jgi:hypothetical protein
MSDIIEWQFAMMFSLLALSGVSATANAVCPEKQISLCEIVLSNPVVVHAKVGSKQRVVDEDDPEGVAGWIYHLEVIKDYRHGKRRSLAVSSVNTTARLILETGKEYIVYAGPNSEGQLEAGTYCDNYTDMEFNKTIEQKVQVCLRNEKVLGQPDSTARH